MDRNGTLRLIWASFGGEINITTSGRFLKSQTKRRSGVAFHFKLGPDQEISAWEFSLDLNSINLSMYNLKNFS